MNLNLFPVRVPIGTGTDKTGAQIDILMTPEFARALSSLFNVLNGSSGESLTELAALLYQALVPVPAPMVADHFDTQPDFAGQIAALRSEVADLALALQPAATPTFADSQYGDQVLVPVAPNTALQDFITMLPPASATDWEHAGKIGFRTPNSAAFTTVSASGLLTANGAIRLNGTNSSTTGVGNYVRWSTNIIMQTEATNLLLITKIFNGAIFVDSMTVSSTAVSMPGTLTPAGGFGCNGKAAQTAFASGAALAAYAAGANGLATGAAMAALVAKVQAIDTALINNGITS